MSRPLAITILGSVAFIAAAAMAIMKVGGWGWFMFIGFMLTISL